MSIQRVVADACCDKCGNGYTVHCRSMTGPNGVRFKLRRLGWVTYTGKDYCPNCRPKEQP